MPRVSKVQTAANHSAIEAAASRLFRARGLGGVSVSELMAEAGLTHGAFYAHYPSKNALAAAACAAAFAAADTAWRQRAATAANPAAARQAIAADYLRDANRDPAVAACPTATLAGDVAREADTHPIHAVYVDGVRRQIDVLAAFGTSGDAGQDRADACLALATMMGALLIARATHGDAVADEVLAAARHRLASPEANQKKRRSARKLPAPRRRSPGGAR